ncbi:peptide chain release factor-like protein [unidentified eubacterium SCB49]|nr:peptide chain release factor-like protein [unidentified eubacterium SCB49]
MGLTLADSYYLKAKAATSDYCCDWEEATEALNYALSYDENHSGALCLLGEIYAKNLAMPDQAFECFDKVLASNTTYHQVYITYARYLIWYDELERAKKLLDFAKTIKAIPMGQLYCVLASLEETQGTYKKGLSYLKKAKKHCYNENYFYFIEEEEKRIKKKMKLDKKSKSTSKKSKKTKKKSKKKK